MLYLLLSILTHLPLLARQAPTAEAGFDARTRAAEALGTPLTWGELDGVLLDRHALSELGRASLKHLLELRLIAELGAAAGLEVSETEIDRKWEEIDRGIKTAGDESGIEGELERNRVSRTTLRETLRLAIMHEELTRKALGIRRKKPVTGEQQTMWLDEQLALRGHEVLPRPWAPVVARSGAIEIRRAEFLEHLRQQLEPDEIREACYQRLLEKRMQARMPDLSPEALDQAVAAEIARRRRDAERDPAYKGLSFESLVQASGMSIAALERDPAVRVAALSMLWVDRSYSSDDLREVYESEREHFDGQFGEAIETKVIFVRGAEFKNELNPRSFEEAEAELRALKPKIRTEADFVTHAKLVSEDKRSREQDGSLGWVARDTSSVPTSIREAVFAALESGRYPREGGKIGRDQRLIGPLRISNGCTLLWLGDRRPFPTWEGMQRQVHRELRARFIAEVLPRSSLTTYLDAVR